MKKIYQSKTFWFAVLTGVIGVLQAVVASGVSSQIAGYITIIIGLANIILRAVTTEPIQTPFSDEI